jgi:hypothetical protein
MCALHQRERELLKRKISWAKRAKTLPILAWPSAENQSPMMKDEE